MSAFVVSNHGGGKLASRQSWASMVPRLILNFLTSSHLRATAWLDWSLSNKSKEKLPAVVNHDDYNTLTCHCRASCSTSCERIHITKSSCRLLALWGLEKIPNKFKRVHPVLVWSQWKSHSELPALDYDEGFQLQCLTRFLLETTVSMEPSPSPSLQRSSLRLCRFDKMWTALCKQVRKML